MKVLFFLWINKKKEIAMKGIGKFFCKELNGDREKNKTTNVFHGMTMVTEGGGNGQSTRQ